MTYLILDTNIWIYLANGFDSVSSTFSESLHTDAHFELFYSLKTKVLDGEIKILINDIILFEFERNKNYTTDLIKELNKEKKEIIEKLKQIKKFLNADTLGQSQLNNIKKEVLNNIDEKIKRNEQHVLDIESFLKTNCLKMPISNQNYIDATKLAIEKKAPFHKNKNNAADTVILLSAIDFVKKLNLNDFNHAIFVSNNVEEYASNPKEVEAKFHNDILILLDNLPLFYKRHLWQAVELTDEMQEYLTYWELMNEEKKFWCLLPHCVGENVAENTYGYFKTVIKVLKPTNFPSNLSQLVLFEFTKEESENTNHVPKTQIGKCEFCNTTHLRCPHCKTLTCDPEGTGDFFCTECERIYKIVNHERLDEKVLCKSNFDMYC